MNQIKFVVIVVVLMVVGIQLKCCREVVQWN